MNKENIEISAEALAMLDVMENVNDYGTKRKFTEEEDKILIVYYKEKKKRELAKYFKCSIPTIRKRYIELTEKK